MYSFENPEEFIAYVEESLTAKTQEEVKLKILCVDNGTSLVKRVSRFGELKKCTSSMSVLRPNGLSSVVSHLKKHDVDVLIIDLNFEELDNYQAGDYIKRALGRDISIIYSGPELEKHLKKLNQNKFL